MKKWQSKDRKELRWVEEFTKILDNKFTLPGTRFRFGLDPILGLIPGAGDAISLGMSGLLILTMARHGASGELVLRMVGNIFIDTIIGAIPILGNIFDFYYKANQRNMNLLKAHYEEGKYRGSGKGIVIAVVVILLAMIVFIVWLFVELLQWIF